MRIGVPVEGAHQPLVAATPDTVAKLIKLGYEVVVEAGAGATARFPDRQYLDAGATLTDAATAWGSDIVVSLDAPAPDRLELTHPHGLWAYSVFNF